jgi:hypothetical protein
MKYVAERDSCEAGDLIKRQEAEIVRYRAAWELLRLDVLFIGSDSTPCLLCSDTFGYACADCEEVAWEDLPHILEMYQAGGWPSIVRWIANVRGSQPLQSVQDAMGENDALRAEIKRLRGGM